MNLVVDDAVEVKMEPKEDEAPRKQLGPSHTASIAAEILYTPRTDNSSGRILLKGDNVSLIQDPAARG